MPRVIPLEDPAALRRRVSPRRWPTFVALLGVLVSLWALVACKPIERELAPKSQTWAELRVVRRGVKVVFPGEAERAPYARERLVDGAVVKVEPSGLVWLRRDAGVTTLVRGPAELVVQPEAIEVRQGRVFVDTPAKVVAELLTPSGPLHLAAVRASLDVGAEGSTVHVLAGEVRAAGSARAGAGERLSLRGKADAKGEGVKAEVSPTVAWDDWTGGLATTDRSPEPAPFGVGTIGARAPGSLGQPRLPLSIQRLDVDVRIDGDLAETEVSQVFFNPSSEVVEGIYRFRTPPQASIARFGVDRGDGLVWGRVKEKAAAAAQYQSNVYAGSTEDPALLEWDAPGEYKARLYPIGPGETRTVVVRYTEWLARSGAKGERRLYVYPMAAEGAEESLPFVEELRLRMDLSRSGAKELRSGLRAVRLGPDLVVRAHDFVPRADLSVELYDDGLAKPRALVAAHEPDLEVLQLGDRTLAQSRAREEARYVAVPLRLADVPEPAGGLDLAVVVDTSAATDPTSLALSAAATSALLAHLGGDDRVAVYTGDVGLTPVGGDLAAIDDQRRRALLAELASASTAGATDVGAVLAEAAQRLDPARRGAVVYIGDGRATVGERTLKDLRARLDKLPRPVRMFALAVGADPDLPVLSGLARGGFAERVADGHQAGRVVLRLLEAAERPALLDVSADFGPAVERVYPRSLGALVADETLLFIGRLKGEPPSKVVISTPSGKKEFDLETRSGGDAGDLRRRWAESRLADLLEEGAGHAALVDLGSRHGVITPVTSLYVPTTNEMTADERTAARRQREKRMDRTKLERKAAEEAAQARYEAEQAESFAKSDAKEGGSGARAKGEEGSMGAPPSRGRNARFGVPTDLPVAGAAAPSPAAPPMAQAAAPASPAAESRAAPMASAAAPMPTAAPAGPTGDLLGEPEPSKPAPGAMGWTTTSETIGLGGLGNVGTGSGGGGLGGRGPGQGFGAGSGRLAGNKDKAKAREPNGGTKKPASLDGDGREDGTRSPSTDGFAGGAPPSGPAPVAIVVRVGDAPLHRIECSQASRLPLSERLPLWRERFQGVQPSRAASLYRAALARCEAPTARERNALLAVALDAIPKVEGRVELWRALYKDLGARDVLYRGILARIRTTDELRSFHRAIGLRFVDPGELERRLGAAKTPAEKVTALREMVRVWPDDLALHLRLLDALEDAGDTGAALAKGRELRARPDATAAVRTAVGELLVRLSEQADKPDAKAARLAEAKRVFGELVEFAPDDPVARRRLGDLLRAHGWYAEAARQYESLRALTPDDPSVLLLLAACSNGLGKLEEAVLATEKAGQSSSYDVEGSPARTSAALASTFLAWGRADARKGGRTQELDRLVVRQKRIPALSRAGGVIPLRVTLVWSHPDLHPALWSNALGAAMPASEGDPLVGVMQVAVPSRADAFVEVRLDPADLEHASRLGATAELTIVVDEGEATEKVHRRTVKFDRDPPGSPPRPPVLRVTQLATEPVIARPSGDTQPGNQPATQGGKR